MSEANEDYGEGGPHFLCFFLMRLGCHCHHHLCLATTHQDGDGKDDRNHYNYSVIHAITSMVDLVVCIQKVHHGHSDEEGRCVVTKVGYWYHVGQYYLYAPPSSSKPSIFDQIPLFSTPLTIIHSAE
jgi:hypothetical protein